MAFTLNEPLGSQADAQLSKASSLTAPPSIIFPVLGGTLGYLLSKSVWGAAFGATAGALFNAASTAVALETKVAQTKGINLVDSNLSIAARSFLGHGVADPLKDPALKA